MKRRQYADKETLHAAIRKAVGENGGQRISYRDFLATAGMRQRDLFRHYPRWQDALRGAGFKFKPYHRPVGPGALLAEWGAVVRKLRRIPSQGEYRIHGPREGTLVGRQFGSWLNLPAAFRRYACRGGKRKEWADVLSLIDTLPQKKYATRPPATSTTRRPRFIRKPVGPKSPPRRMRDRPCYGDQLDLPALRHAPNNEQGVIYLFGILAARLGFSVERMQPAFPDCQGKRRTGRSAAWQDVLIEFEFASRNFHTHRHNPKGCDIIVCWIHNWPECPKNLEVIALSEELKRLTSSRTDAPDR